jgi:hypothetical protein
MPEIADGTYAGVDVEGSDLKTYKIHRQASNPSTRPGNTAGPPQQFPRGVGLDVLASGVEYRIPDPADIDKFLQYSFTSLQSRNLAVIEGIDLTKPADRPWPRFEPPLTVGVMFAPTGGLAGVWVNGEKLQDDFWVRPDRLYLLVGRSENSIRTLEEIGIDFTGNGSPGNDGLADFTQLDPIPADPADDDPGAEDVAARRAQLNWLNADSLWVTVTARTGRIVTSPNDVGTDPRVFAQNNQVVAQQIANQLRAARTFAREQESVGGQ